MEIKGTPKEIADFVKEIQSQLNRKKLALYIPVKKDALKEQTWLKARKKCIPRWSNIEN